MPRRLDIFKMMLNFKTLFTILILNFPPLKIDLLRSALMNTVLYNLFWDAKKFNKTPDSVQKPMFLVNFDLLKI